jgi:hypothetical protein
MQKKYYLLILILTVLIGLFTGYSVQQYNSPLKSSINIQNSNQHQNTDKNINPENSNIKKYFKKVVKVPYKANYKSNVPKKPSQFWKDNYGDCDDKGAAFADYLNKLGAEDVKIVIILHDSKEYAHCAVLWKDHIFDPSAEPPIYNMNKTRYFNFLKKIGFNLQVTYPYSYYKNSYFQKSN